METTDPTTPPAPPPPPPRRRAAKGVAVRSSSTPLLLACHQSANVQGIEMEVANETGPLGSAVHEAMATWINEGRVADPVELADRYGVGGQADDVAELSENGRAVWETVREHFPHPITEQAMAVNVGPHVVLTGHADVHSLAAADAVHVLDFKTGRKRRNYYDQLASYGLQAAAQYGVPRANVWVAYLRDEHTEYRAFDGADLAAFAERVAAAAAGRAKARYVVGDHCEHCPRFAECPARRQLVQSVVTDLATNGAWAVRDVQKFPDVLGDLAGRGQLTTFYAAVQMVENALGNFREQLRQRLAQADLVQPDGHGFTLAEHERRHLDAMAAWPVLQQWLQPQQLSECVKVSLTTATELAAAAAPRGTKGKVKEQLAAQLEDAGAVRRTVTRKIKPFKPAALAAAQSE